MVCRADQYRGGDEAGKYWSNWVGSVKNRINRYLEPGSLAELVDVVAQATEGGHEIHALGSGWAFEDLATSDDWVVSLARLTADLTDRYGIVDQALTDNWRHRHNDGAGRDRLVHVEAGVEIGLLNAALSQRGLAMRTLGGANGQTLAGAVSTSTHGGDPAIAPFPDQVQALHLVTDGGRELWLERRSAPVTTDARLRPLLPCADTEIIRDDDVFEAAVVSVGRFGVIYSMLVHVTPAFRLAEWTAVQPTVDMLSALESGVATGTGLAPVHALLPRPPASLGADESAPPHFFQLVFNSLDTVECYVQRRWPTAGDDLKAEQGESFVCHHGAAPAILVAAAAALRTAVPGLLLIPVVGLYWAARAEAGALALDIHAATRPDMPSGEALALSVNAAWAANLKLGALVNRTALHHAFADSLATGRRGPSHILTSGTRGARQSDCFRGESIEVVFSAMRPDYLLWLQVILAAAPSFHQCGYISARYSAPSTALMSMHNSRDEMVVSIEVASLKGMEGNGAWIQFVESMAIAHGGRPHWGQINRLSEADVTRLYGENLVRWCEALLAVSGTSTMFSNHYTRQRGLEPAGTAHRIARSAAPWCELLLLDE